MRYLFSFVFLSISFFGFSQYRFIPFYDTPIVHPNEELKAFPWAGGLNGVQYGKVDLNNDGIDDIAAYDRSSGRVLCFLRNGETYEYAPQYEAFLPSEIQNFFILKDYDGD